MLLALDWHFAFILFHSSYLLPTIPALFSPLSAYLDILLVPPGCRLMLDRPGLPRDHPGCTIGRLGPSQTHSKRTADHSPPLAATCMTHYHCHNPTCRPITTIPSFATPRTCYHSSILSSAQVLHMQTTSTIFVYHPSAHRPLSHTSAIWVWTVPHHSSHHHHHHHSAFVVS